MLLHLRYETRMLSYNVFSFPRAFSAFRPVLPCNPQANISLAIAPFIFSAPSMPPFAHNTHIIFLYALLVDGDVGKFNLVDCVLSGMQFDRHPNF